ncbi:MAG: hypothetical protein OEZ58_04955, partial [Gammaproteobacteria bacterium]|nr:hypothetical protein [Gammaproteobacteria bacterium]
AWPLTGIALLDHLGINIPDWIVTWSLFTALLYAIRLLTIREISLWTSFIASSAWALLWISLQGADDFSRAYFYAISFSLPLALLILLSDQLTQRFGAAYVGLYGGLAQTQPRLSGVLVMVILAVVATPIFPAFFALMHTIIAAIPGSLGTAISVGIVWLLWSWGGARVINGLIVGPAKHVDYPDITLLQVWNYWGVLLGLFALSIFFVGASL